MLDCEVTTLAQWVQVYFCKDQERSRFERALLSGAHELTETLYRGIKDKIQYWYMCVCCESNIVVGLWRSKHVFHLLARKQLLLRRREGARKNKNKDQIRYLTRSLPSWVQFFPLLCNWNKYFSFWKRFFCNRSLEGFQEKHVPLLRNVTNLCRQSIKTRIKPQFLFLKYVPKLVYCTQTAHYAPIHIRSCHTKQLVAATCPAPKSNPWQDATACDTSRPNFAAATCLIGIHATSRGIELHKGRFTRYDFVECNLLTTLIRPRLS